MVDPEILAVESSAVRRARRPHAEYRLICFPHAGAGAAGFAGWTRWLPQDVELVAVQLPGREDRIRERPLTSMATAVRTVALALRPYLRGRFALFGHSVGGMLAFELARTLSERGPVRPEHLLVSGLVPPGHPATPPPLHDLPEDGFLAALRELGGMTGPVAADENLLRVLLPTLRADFALGENHRHIPGKPLDIPVTAIAGNRDERAPVAALEAWRDHTTGPFELRRVDGDHFSVTESGAELVAAIAVALRQEVPTS